MLDKLLLPGSNDWLESRLDEINNTSIHRNASLNALISEILPSQAEIIEQALALAKSIEDLGERAQALSKISSCLSETERCNILDDALDIVDLIPEENDTKNNPKFDALIAVIKQLPATSINLQIKALRITDSIAERKNYKITALLEVIKRSEGNKVFWNKAFRITNSLKVDRWKVTALYRIIERLPQDDKPLWETAYNSANLLSGIDQALALSKIIFCWGEVEKEWRQELADILRRRDLVKDPDEVSLKLWSLWQLASKTEKQHQGEYLDVILNDLKLIPTEKRARLLADILDGWPELFRDEILKQTIQAIEENISENGPHNIIHRADYPIDEENNNKASRQKIIKDLNKKAEIIRVISAHISIENHEYIERVRCQESLISSRLLTLIDTVKSKYQFINILGGFQSHVTASQVLCDATSVADKLSETYRLKLLDKLVYKVRSFSIDSQNFEDQHIQTFLLSFISSKLSGLRRYKLIEQALDLANSIVIDDEQTLHLNPLISVLNYLPNDSPRLLRKVFLTINSIGYDRINGRLYSEYSDRFLSLLANRIPEYDFTLIEQLLKIDNVRVSINVFKSVVVKLPRSEPRLLRKALEISRTFEEKNEHVDALISIIPKLPNYESSISQLMRVLKALQSNEYENRRIYALALGSIMTDQSSLTTGAQMVLSSIVDRLIEAEGSFLGESLKVAQEITDPIWKTKACVSIAKRLSEPYRTDELESILNSYEAPSIAIGSLNKNNGRLIEKVYKRLEQADDSLSKVKSLFSISRLYQSDEKRRVIENSFKILKSEIEEHEDTDDFFSALEKPECFYEDIISIVIAFLVENLTDVDENSADTEFLLDALFETFSAIDSKYQRSRIICSIASKISHDLGKKVVEKFQLDSRTVAMNCPILLGDVSLLLDEILNEIEILKKKDVNETNDYRQLEKILPFLPRTDYRLEEIVNLLTNISSSPSISSESKADSQREAALAGSLEVVNLISEENNKISALKLILACLNETDNLLLESVIKISDKLTSVSEKRIDILCKLAPLLSEHQRNLTIQKALGIIGDIRFTGAVIGSRRSSAEQSKWSDSLRQLTPYISRNILEDFLKLVFKLPDAAKNIACLNSSTREYFSLYCPANKHSTALNAVQYIDDEACKTQYLSSLVPHISRNRCFYALKLVQSSFTSDRYRTEALCNLAPYLSTSHLSDAFELATKIIRHPLYSVVALEALIPISQGYYFKDETRLHDLLEFIESLRYPQLQARVLKVLSVELAITVVKNSVLVKGAALKLLEFTKRLKQTNDDGFSYERTASDIFYQLIPVISSLVTNNFNLVDKRESTIDAFRLFEEFIEQLQDLDYQAKLLIASATYFPKLVESLLPKFQGDSYRELLKIKIQLALLGNPDLPAEAKLLNLNYQCIQSSYIKAEVLVEIVSHPVGSTKQVEALRAIQNLQNNSYLPG